MTEPDIVLKPGDLLTIAGRDRPFRLIGVAQDARGELWGQAPAHVFFAAGETPSVVTLTGSDIVLGVHDPRDDLILTRGADIVASGHFPPLDMLIASFRIDPKIVTRVDLGFSPFWPTELLPAATALNVRAIGIGDYLELDGRPESNMTHGQVSAIHGLTRVAQPGGGEERIYNQVIEIEIDSGVPSLPSWELFLSQDGGLIGPAVATDGNVKIVASLHAYMHMRDLRPWTPPERHRTERDRLEARGIEFNLVDSIDGVAA